MLINEPIHDESALQIMLIESNVLFNRYNVTNSILPHEYIESHKMCVTDVSMIKLDKKHDTELLQIIVHDVVLS